MSDTELEELKLENERLKTTNRLQRAALLATIASTVMAMVVGPVFKSPVDVVEWLKPVSTMPSPMPVTMHPGVLVLNGTSSCVWSSSISTSTSFTVTGGFKYRPAYWQGGTGYEYEWVGGVDVSIGRRMHLGTLQDKPCCRCGRSPSWDCVNYGNLAVNGMCNECSIAALGSER